jgi:sulfur carrier protein ThiS
MSDEYQSDLVGKSVILTVDINCCGRECAKVGDTGVVVRAYKYGWMTTPSFIIKLDEPRTADENVEHSDELSVKFDDFELEEGTSNLTVDGLDVDEVLGDWYEKPIVEVPAPLPPDLRAIADVPNYAFRAIELSGERVAIVFPRDEVELVAEMHSDLADALDEAGLREREWVVELNISFYDTSTTMYVLASSEDSAIDQAMEQVEDGDDSYLDNIEIRNVEAADAYLD